MEVCGVKENTDIKLSFISKFAYGMGDVGCNFSWMFVGNFLMIFYSDVFGISMSAVARLMLFSRFWDAINDPIVGGLTDRTKSRWGRYRPWLLIAAPITAPENVTLSEAYSFADFGNATASLCVESYGAIPAMPDMEAVCEKLGEERL